jgi:hypothetical protein
VVRKEKRKQEKKKNNIPKIVASSKPLLFYYMNLLSRDKCFNIRWEENNVLNVGVSQNSLP